MNRRAVSALRVDGKLSADDFQPLLRAGKPSPGPLIAAWDQSQRLSP